MSGSFQGFIFLLPHITTALHPQWIKYRFLHEIIQLLAGDMFDNLREIYETFTRIDELLARCEVDLQFGVSSSPVGETSCVRKDASCGHLRETRILTYIVVSGQILVQWLV